MMEESFIDIVNSLERATDTIYQEIGRAHV